MFSGVLNAAFAHRITNRNHRLAIKERMSEKAIFIPGAFVEHRGDVPLGFAIVVLRETTIPQTGKRA